MTINLIAALDENNGIGKDNQLLCHLPADLKHFKQITSGHSIVMGRKTFESLPNGPLPNRKNIILTRNYDFEAKGAIVVHSVKEAIHTCADNEQIFIIGGEEIYRLFIQKADILQITRIHHRFDADAFFPVFSNDEWELTESIDCLADEKNKFDYSFLIFTKK